MENSYDDFDEGCISASLIQKYSRDTHESHLFKREGTSSCTSPDYSLEGINFNLRGARSHSDTPKEIDNLLDSTDISGEPIIAQTPDFASNKRSLRRSDTALKTLVKDYLHSEEMKL